MAIADLLRTLGGKVNTGISNVGNTFANMNAQPTGILTPEQQRALTERQQKANLLFALGDAFKGKDIGQNYLAREQNFMAMDAARQAKAREQQLRSSIENDESIDPNLKILMGQNPEVYGRYKLSLAQEGRAKSAQLEEENRLAEIEALKKLRQKQALENIGLTEREISLFQNAGMSMKDIQELSNPDSDIEQKLKENRMIRDSQIKDKIAAGFTRDQAIAIVDKIPERFLEDNVGHIIDESNEIVETLSQDTGMQNDYSNLDQAFGPIDALQETIFNKPSRLLFGSDPAGVTAAAIRDRDNLNLEILATLANDYTGRPSNLLLGEIKKNIPEGSATSEADAFQKYSNFKIQTKSRIANLEQGIRSANVSNATKEKYREELVKSKVLLKKLDAASASLAPDNVSLKSNQESSSQGTYDNFFTNEGN